MQLFGSSKLPSHLFWSRSVQKDQDFVTNEKLLRLVKSQIYYSLCSSILFPTTWMSEERLLAAQSFWRIQHDGILWLSASMMVHLVWLEHISFIKNENRDMHVSNMRAVLFHLLYFSFYRAGHFHSLLKHKPNYVIQYFYSPWNLLLHVIINLLEKPKLCHC